MEKLRIFNGERYLTKDMDNIQDTKARAITNRTKDLFTVGIVKATIDTTDPAIIGDRLTGNVVVAEFPITVNGTDPTKIDVGNIVGIGVNNLGGLAYDGDGNRIAIDENKNYPQGDVNAYTRTNVTTTEPVTYLVSSGNIGIPLTTLNQDYYVWIEYLDVVADADPLSVSKDKFGITHLTRQISGYRIVLTTTNVPPTSVTQSIFIGKATRTITGLVVDLTGRIYSRVRAELGEAIVDVTVLAPTDYVDKSIITIQDHVNSKGSLAISKKNPHGLSVSDIGGATPADLADHRIKQHTAGIITTVATGTGTGRNSITSMLHPIISGTQIQIKNLAPSTEQAYAEGALLVDTDIHGTATSFAGRAITGTTTLVGDFNAPSPLASDCYVFYLKSDGVVYGDGVGSIVIADVVTKINTLTLEGKLVICAVNWNSGTFTLTDMNGKIIGQAGYRIDYRSYGSISSKDIEPADGVSGQDVTIGEGVKTSHIQDFAVTASKTDFSVRKINESSIYLKQAGAGTSIISFYPNTRNISFSMDGFYCKRYGGYVKRDSVGNTSISDGTIKSLTEVDAIPEIVLPLVGSSGGGLCTGNVVANHWYSVMAIETATDPSKFTIRYVPFIHVATAAGNTINPSRHNYTETTILTANNWTVNAFAGCQAFVLTGNMGGQILDIVSNTANSLTVSQSVSTMNSNSWIMVSPSKNPSVYNHRSFRYLGAVYCDGGGLRAFRKSGNFYQHNFLIIHEAPYTNIKDFAMSLTSTNGQGVPATSGVAPTASSVRLLAYFSPILNTASSMNYGPGYKLETNIVRHDIVTSAERLVSTIHMATPRIEVDDNTTGGSLVIWVSIYSTQTPAFGETQLSGWEE